MPTPVDVVIVGAGPSGAVAATTLAEHGFKVVVLERGTWPDYSTLRTEAPDLEMFEGRDWSPRPDIRNSQADQPIDESDSESGVMIWNGVGGSAVAYAGQWMRSMPSDFRTRTLDGVGDDWPLTYNDLIPYYKQVEQDFGISGLNGDPAVPASNYPMPPVRARAWGKRVGAAHNRLGWHWWPGSNAIATARFGPLRPCTERGTCMQGCIEGAKSTPDITHWPTAIRLGVELKTQAHVSQIHLDSRGRATGVAYFDQTGTEWFQEAGVVVLAANGVGTPWLLLNSATPTHPDGLANASGLVGQRLMMHPLSTVAGVFDDDMGSSQGPWGQDIYSLEFYETDASRGFVRGAKWGLTPTGGPYMTTQSYPWGKPTFWGPEFLNTVRARLGRSAAWSIICEDLPEESNAVSLSDEVHDKFGMPAPKLTYKKSQNTNNLLRWHEARAIESLTEAGASDIRVAPAIRNTGWHLLGTAKMGEDPTTSVVDSFGRTHEVPNLYIFDGSTWPTSTGMNPTATIAALALRNVDALIRTRRKQVTSATR